MNDLTQRCRHGIKVNERCLFCEQEQPFDYKSAALAEARAEARAEIAAKDARIRELQNELESALERERDVQPSVDAYRDTHRDDMEAARLMRDQLAAKDARIAELEKALVFALRAGAYLTQKGDEIYYDTGPVTGEWKRTVGTDSDLIRVMLAAAKGE